MFAGTGLQHYILTLPQDSESKENENAAVLPKLPRLGKGEAVFHNLDRGEKSKFPAHRIVAVLGGEC